MTCEPQYDLTTFTKSCRRYCDLTGLEAFSIVEEWAHRVAGPSLDEQRLVIAVGIGCAQNPLVLDFSHYFAVEVLDRSAIYSCGLAVQCSTAT